MATIGMDSLYYATITEDNLGIETYSTPQVLAKAISAELTIDIVEESLFADDGVCFTIKEFKSGKLTLSTADLSPQVISDLTGAKMDDNGVLVSSSEDGGKTTAIAFRAKRPEGNYRYFWLMKVKFASPSVSLQTKGDSIQFNTPKIEGTIMRRNKLDAFGTHPWKVEVTEGGAGVPASVVAGWFSSVYEATVTDNEP